MNLTKSDKKELEDILWKLKQAERFVMKPEISICTTDKFTGAIIPLTKEIGSDLAYLYRSIDLLQNFINNR